MTTLTIPLHQSLVKSQNLLTAELHHREIRSFKVRDGFITIEHERRPPQTGIWL